MTERSREMVSQDVNRTFERATLLDGYKLSEILKITIYVGCVALGAIAGIF